MGASGNVVKGPWRGRADMGVPDGTILDFAADRLGGAPLRVIAPGDPAAEIYRDGRPAAMPDDGVPVWGEGIAERIGEVLPAPDPETSPCPS
ncbi:hypothetical protein [Defluviimonas salinarum]|uniref:Uncharacterized protein n=1 Tax=Defluviimonas salinarum TaxID=2992147 RepID=A0ABT3J5J8_9RHOB|nr:hypothetical protein [Defluviimonas salinarum]MCW3782940.1 hypothetical protein [Defluviimonas salinarum]